MVDRLVGHPSGHGSGQLVEWIITERERRAPATMAEILGDGFTNDRGDTRLAAARFVAQLLIGLGGQTEIRCREATHGVGTISRYRDIRQLVLVSMRKAPGCQLIASIGHELQHAVEVLANPKVRSTFEMFLFFDRTAPAGWRDSFETDEAVQAGLRVDREMCH